MLTLCCRPDMGAALKPQEGESCDDATVAITPPTMADVIRERKKKAGGAGFATLRRLIPRRPNAGGDKGCEHARFIRSVVYGWALSDVFLLCECLEAGAALRDLVTQAELAREPAPAASHALHMSACCDIELVGYGWSVPACRVLLAVRSSYFATLLQHYPDSYRIPLEGAVAALTRTQMLLCVHKLYSHTTEEWDRIRNSEELVDIDNVNSLCTCGESNSVDTATLDRICEALLGASTRPLQADLKRLLQTGDMADCKLAFLAADGGLAHEVSAHRAVLSARSRLLRSTLARRNPSSKESSVICVDEKVFSWRFARALLHAAYTDQVDLSLVSRPAPPAGHSAASTTSWGRGNKVSTAAMLEDAFQLYEIAKFLEMPIAMQGCEDAIVEALSPATLPAVLAWAGGGSASAWVQRQALRYLRDEYPTIMSSSHAWGVPRGALLHALASPCLQASESQALRGILRWGGARNKRGTAHVHDLVALVRAPLLPDACEYKAQAVRRGLMPAVTTTAAEGWLQCPPRAFLPYLDALKALLENQSVPEAELARVRRARGLHPIPDTLYMVRDTQVPGATGCASALDRACVSGRTLRQLRSRMRALANSRSARRALAARAHNTHSVYLQLALRAVREKSLPDSCAELLLSELDFNTLERERRTSSVPPDYGRASPPTQPLCRGGSESGSLRCSVSSAHQQNINLGSSDSSLSGTCRREGSTRTLDLTPHSARAAAGRLSARVPDVAMPNANTHLLTHASYLQYSGILQLDLGDGATHTPRPGSRAQRASTSGQSRPHRERTHMACNNRVSTSDEASLRHSIDITYMRGFNALGGRLATLPHPHQQLSRASSADSRGSTSRAHTRTNSMAEHQL